MVGLQCTCSWSGSLFVWGRIFNTVPFFVSFVAGKLITKSVWQIAEQGRGSCNRLAYHLGGGGGERISITSGHFM